MVQETLITTEEKASTKEKLQGIAMVVVWVGYLLLGLAQWTAVYSGLHTGLGLWWIIAAPHSFLIAYIPLIGTISGIAGAYYGLGWSFWASVALFFGPMLVILAFAFVGGTFSYLAEKRRNS